MFCQRWSLRAISLSLLALVALVPALATSSAAVAQSEVIDNAIEIHVKDCGLAPEGKTVFVDDGDPAPAGFEACVPGNVETRQYDALVNGEAPTYASGDTAIWTPVSNGNYIATAAGGARDEFEIRDWTVVLDLYTKGTVTSEPPVTELPETGVGLHAFNRNATTPLSLLAASLVLGYISLRTTRTHGS